MPITYDVEDGVVRRWFTGAIRPGEFDRHWREMLADPALPDPLLLLCDLRACELEMHGEDIRHSVRSVIEPALAGRRWASAAVVASPVAYGVAKQFNAYSEHIGVTEVFHDMDAALEWLAAVRGA